MIRETVRALLACLITFVLCAVAYPAVVWGLGQLMFPHQASGSLILSRDKTVIGSELIAQPFVSDKYFWPRPSAVDYKADATGGSNLGTTNPDQRKKVEERAANLKATKDSPAPVDMVMASGAGLDPDVTVEAARYQAARVAEARKLPVEDVRKLIDEHTNTSGAILGASPRVNVLKLNLALDEQKPVASPPAAKEKEEAKTTDATPAGAPEPAAKPADAEAKLDAPAPKQAQAETPAPKQPEATPPTEALTRRLDRIESDDLKELKAQVARLTEVVGSVGRATEKLGAVDERVAAVDRGLQTLRSEVKAAGEPPRENEQVGALTKEVQKFRADLDALGGSVAKLEAADREVKRAAAGPDLGPGMKQFQGRNYVAASGLFRALTKTNPDDARVWYLAALSNGLATNQWTGETLNLANKAVERERAGTPSKGEIDAALAGLTRETGRDWLARFRQQAARR